MNEVIRAIEMRRSVRKFTGAMIPRSELETILHAGSYAPNGMGSQEWRFTAVQDEMTLQRINESIRLALLTIPVIAETHPYVVSLIEKAGNEQANFNYGASTYVIVSHQRDNGNAMPDSALALGYMMLAAHSMGIGSCWLNLLPGMAGLPIIRNLMTELGLPENHTIYACAVFGYAAKEPEAAEPRKDVVRIL